jgi:hypothetical protein
MMPGEAGPLTERGITYSTTLPTGSSDWRRSLSSTVSIILHLVLIILVIRTTHQRQAAEAQRTTTEETTRPIQLDFAPPRPIPTPRPPQPVAEAPKTMPPAVPLTPGPDKDPGSTARVNPDPEPEPNAPANTTPETATRPDPGNDNAPEETPKPAVPSPGPPSTIAAPLASDAPSMEADARRIFGRPSSKLGPVSGTRDNRPWESPVELNSKGCTLPPPDPADSTLPAGMSSITGKIYDERTGQPLSGARLQILGTGYGTFANAKGEYTLVFERSLVDHCRSQSVRVTAIGYPGRDVVLYIGPGGTDVPLRRF